MSLMLSILAAAAAQVPASPQINPPPIIAVTGSRDFAWRLPPGQRVYSASEAVLGAANRPGGGLLGEFVFVVRATGWDGGRLYLNSETDYRDPRNLSIVIEPDVARQLTARPGADGQQNFVGRIVVARGMARTTRIDFTIDYGKPSGKYYFQTQVSVGRAEQLRMID